MIHTIVVNGMGGGGIDEATLIAIKQRREIFSTREDKTIEFFSVAVLEHALASFAGNCGQREA